MRVSAGLLLLALALLSAVKVDSGLQEDLDVAHGDDDDEQLEISTSLKLENRTLVGKNAQSNIRTGQMLPSTNGTSDGTSLALILGNATKTIGLGEHSLVADEDKPEKLPEALELRYNRPKYRRPYYSPTRRSPLDRRNVHHHDKSVRASASSLRPARRPHDPKRPPTENECTFFSKTVCLEAAGYPIDAIRRSIRNNKEMIAALLADFKVKDSGINEEEDLSRSSYKTSSYNNRYDKRYDNRFETSNEIKRKYEFNSLYGSGNNVEEGYTCPSQVKYAQPQLARAASGVWKYIINTGEHTQTLRLEKCLNPQASCSFISENYRSSCVQVYNYHRLLTWDSKLGLHMDIFKVPTCCSCHVHGYADLFPPHQTDPPIKAQEPFPGADFATSDSHLSKGSTKSIHKYGNSLDSAALNLFRESYGQSGQQPTAQQEETQLQHSSSSSRRPSVARPPRPRKPTSVPRPFDSKLPQQHAPNTRAPGYKGPRPPFRQNRPFRRESTPAEVSDYSENPANITLNRFSQAFDQDAIEPSSTRLQNGGFDDEYQETQRRINYNYHPIIDFFKPEAALLKSEEPIKQSPEHDSWKPIFKP